MLVDINLVEWPVNILRAPDRQSSRYQNLREDIRKNDCQQPILCRLDLNAKGEWSGHYLVVDGLHRLYIQQDLEYDEIEITVDESIRNDTEALLRSIALNDHRVQTTTADRARALRLIVSDFPTLTRAQLAAKMSITPTTLDRYLRVSALDENILAQVSLSAADELADFVKKTGQQPPADLVALAEKITAGELRERVASEVKRVGRKPKRKKARTRPPADIQTELERARASREPMPPGYIQALEWVLKLDPVSQGANS